MNGNKLKLLGALGLIATGLATLFCDWVSEKNTAELIKEIGDERYAKKEETKEES